MSDGATPSHIDTSKASIARVYDYALGGKDNYDVDRETIHQIEAVAPEAKDLAVENRRFLIRALRFLATQTGVTQFLDCGSGLPTAENTHQVVQRIRPESRVVYVDNDPSVVAHGRALLADNDRTLFSAANIFTPHAVLDDATIRGFLDFDEPIVLIQNGTLHHYDDPANSPQAVMESYVAGLAPGSYVVIAHFFDPEDGSADRDVARRLEDTLLHSPMGTGRFRSRSEIEGMFGGCELVEPGVVLCADWWPDGPRLAPLNQAQRLIAGGVGRRL